MRIFRTLLISQLLSAFLLAAIALTALVLYTQQQLDNDQQHASVAIEQILNHHLSGDGKILSRQLDRSFALKSLRISQLDGTVLHEQNQNNNNAAVTTAVLELFGSEFKQQTVRNQDQNIQISYQLDFSQRLQAFLQLVLLLILAPFVIGWLPVLMSKSSINRSYKRTTAAVNDLIDRFIVDPQKSEPDWNKIPRPGRNFFVNVNLSF